MGLDKTIVFYYKDFAKQCYTPIFSVPFSFGQQMWLFFFKFLIKIGGYVGFWETRPTILALCVEQLEA